MKTIGHLFIQLMIISSLLWHQTSHAVTPSPKIVELTPEQMQQVLKNVRNSDQVKIRYAVADENGHNQEVVLKSKAEEEEEEKEEKEKEPSAGSAVGEFFADLAAGVNDHDSVLVLFAVVGAVITIVWIASIPYSAYKALTGKEKYNYIHFLTLGHSRIISKSPEEFFNRSGDISTLRYNLYFKEKESAETGTFHTGLAAELGHYQLRDSDEFQNRTNHLSGNFWMLGPTVMIGFKPDFIPPIYYKFDLMGGSSFENDINLMAKADLAVLLEVTKEVLFGVNVSANYIDVNSKGIISGSHPDYLLGLNLGYKF